MIGRHQGGWWPWAAAYRHSRSHGLHAFDFKGFWRAYRRTAPSAELKRQQMVERQQNERKLEARRMEERWQREAAARASRLPKGVSGIWSRITGKYGKIKRQNEMDTYVAWQRDRAVRDRLVARQLDERQRLQQVIRKMRDDRARELAEINREIAAYIAMKPGDAPSPDAARRGLESTASKAKDRTRPDAERATRQSERTPARNSTRKSQRTRGRSNDGPEPGMKGLSRARRHTRHTMFP